MKKVALSHMNVDTQFAALSELVEIISPDGRPLSQFVSHGFDTSGNRKDTYKPDRYTNPLTLRPKVNVTDPDEQKTYTPTLTSVLWYVNKQSQGTTTTVTTLPDGTRWYQVTNTTEQNGYYTVKANGDLIVKKNIPENTDTVNNAETVLCMITYADPRTAASVQTSSTAILSTNLDSSAVYDVNILAAKVISYDPLDSSYNPNNPNSLKTITAKAYHGKTDVTSSVYFEWYGLDSGHTTETKIDDTTNPFMCYQVATQPSGKGQGKSSIVLDAMYADSLTIILRIRESSSSPLLPCRDTVSLMWKVPDIDCQPYSEEGAMSRETIKQMTFKPILNAQGLGTLSDSTVKDNFLFEWKRRNSAGSYSTVQWGPDVTLKKDQLTTTNKTSTLVEANVYLKGKLVPVVQDGKMVMQDGKVVVERQ